MKSPTPFFLIAAVLFLSYGCASKPVSVPLSERVPQKIATEKETAGTGIGEVKKGGITEEELLREDEERRKRDARDAAAKASLLKDVYFEFDSYIIKSEYLPALKEIAGWLVKNEAIRLTVEGHCDERGTTEYNLALGQKRAEAVKDYLVKLGVSGSRIRAVSYGKEAPADNRQVEDAWAKNRRAHFVTE
jgi:peptidoglycan-associated lipoprotein